MIGCVFYSESHFATPASSSGGKCAYVSSESGGHDYFQGSPLRLNSGMGYDAFTLMCIGGEEGNFVQDGEGNDSDISNLEDLEVRMDLTDDLLHMVRHRKRVTRV